MIEGELGRGGMGVVYKARQVALNRTVALKVVLAGEFADAREMARFLAEAETVARLTHPDIVQVYEVSRHAGRPFVALEYVSGGTLAAHLRAGPLAPKAAAALIERLARAVQYAHDHGVIHRDLKPANILLAAGEDAPTARNPARDADSTLRSATSELHPKVTDFGLAKRLDTGDGLTETGAVAGTPGYMAPEQALGMTKDATPEMDVYALGAVLYECLAGRPPFVGANPVETMMKVANDDPTPLSRVVRTVPLDLATICMRCLEKAPRRRYRSAAALADDLRAFLDGRPVSARRVGELERAWKWARRRPALAGALAALAVALAAGTAVSVAFAVAADRSAADARSSATAAETRAAEAKASEAAANAARDRATAAERASTRQAAGLLLDRGLETAARGDPAAGLHWMLAGLRALDPADPTAADLARVIRTNLAAWAAIAPRLDAVIPHGEAVWSVAVDPTGTVAATGSADGLLRVWDLATGRLRFPPVAHPGVVLAAFTPDGRTVVTGHHGRNGNDTPLATYTVRRYDAATGAPVGTPVAVGGLVGSLAVHPDGRRVAVGLQVGPGASAFQVVDLRTGRAAFDPRPTGTKPADVVFSPDGQLLVLTGRNAVEPGAVFLADPATGEADGDPLVTGAPRAVAAAFAPDGRAVWIFRDGGGVVGWSLPDRRPLASAPNDPDLGYPVVFAPDGRAVAAGVGPTRQVREWRLPGFRPGPPLPMNFRALAVTPDGERYVSGGEDGYVRVWRRPTVLGREPAPAARPDAAPGRGPIPRAAWRPCGPAVIHEWGRFTRPVTARVIDALAGIPRGVPVRHQEEIFDVALSADSARFATAGRDGIARVWDAATGTPVTPPLAHSNFVHAAAFSPDGRTLATGDFAHQVTLWDIPTGRSAAVLRHDEIVLCVGYSPDGAVLATGTARDNARNPAVRLWDAAARRPLGPPLPHTDHVYQFWFRPDGKALLTLAQDNTVRLWAVPGGTLIGQPVTLPGGSAPGVFSPDGAVVALGAGDGTVRLFDAASMTPFPGDALTYPAAVTTLGFAPDGRTLVVGYRDGAARLWDLATRKPLGPPAVLRGTVRVVGFVAGGAAFVTVADDGTARTWPVPVAVAEPDLDRLATRLELLTGLRMGSDRVTAPVPVADWAKLRAAFTGAPDLTPDPPAADRHHARAQDAEQDGDLAGALWHLDRLAALRPDDWTAHARRGRALYSAGRPDPAATAFAAAARTAPPAALADWLHHRAATAEAAGRDEEAVWYLDHAAAHAPDRWRVYADRAEAKRRLGEPALADVRAAVAAGADAGYVAAAAQARAARGDWAGAAGLYDAATRRGPVPLADWIGFAAAAVAAGDHALYRQACARLLSRPRDDPSGQQAYLTAVVCTIGPGGAAPAAVAELLDDAGRKLVKAEGLSVAAAAQARYQIAVTRAVALVRAGKAAEAVELVRLARLRFGAAEAYGVAVHGFSLAAAGRSTEAAPLLSEARRLGATYPAAAWRERLMLDVLLADATPAPALPVAPPPRPAAGR